MSALCSSCRHFLPLLVILTTTSTLFQSTEGSGTAGKIYPRGNHWAVGHLMGKKSIGSLEDLQHTYGDSEYLRDAREAETTRFERYGALEEPSPEQRMAQPAHRRAQPRSRWRRGGVYKYLREITSLLRMALKLQKSQSMQLMSSL